MFKKGLATIVIFLFLGLAVSPSIYADRDKVSLEPNTDLDIDLNRLELRQLGLKLILNNLRLIFLLMFTPTVVSENYLRKVSDLCLDAFKSLDASERDLLLDSLDIENIEFKEQITDIIEGDVDFDCCCNTDITDLNWSFPVICTVVFIPFLFGATLWKVFDIIPYSAISFIGWIIVEYCMFFSHDLGLYCFWEYLYD